MIPFRHEPEGSGFISIPGKKIRVMNSSKVVGGSVFGKKEI